MLWKEVKIAYPNQWVIIEAIEAHAEGKKRIVTKPKALQLLERLLLSPYNGGK